MNVSPPPSSSSSSETLTSPPTSVSSLCSTESARQIRERLFRTKQVIIVHKQPKLPSAFDRPVAKDEMNAAARAVVSVQKPQTRNWEEREKAIQLNTRLKTDAMMPHIQKLEAWEGQLSPEEKAIMEPTEEEEAHSEQRLAEIMQGEYCC